jgi:hypothetical protein
MIKDSVKGGKGFNLKKVLFKLRINNFEKKIFVLKVKINFIGFIKKKAQEKLINFKK